MRYRRLFVLLLPAALCLPLAVRAASTDLLGYLRVHPAAVGHGGFRIRPMAAHGKTRTSMMTGVPNRFDFPVTLPAHPRLRLGFTILDRFLGGDMIDRTEATRFTVSTVSPDGTITQLRSYVLDPRARPLDRRWVDWDIDLTTYAGQQLTLRLQHERVDDPAADGHVFALWSRPILYDSSEQQKKPNLVFITIDALRADHLSSAGYARATTPRLDQLAASGVRFTQAFTSAPMTVPSLPQIFTAAVFPHADSPNLLSSLFAGGIRRTRAFIHNPFLEYWLSIQARDGFDDFKGTNRRADKITDAAIKWVRSHKDERFALYLHYLDTHTPYRTPAPTATEFVDASYAGPIGDRFGDTEGASSGKYTGADRTRIIDLYDGSIRFVDTHIGRLLDFLATEKLLERTFVVVSADHGEELWEHGSFFHGQSLYDELLHVPLLMRFPGAEHAGGVVAEPVRSLDIVPTIADVLDLPAFPDFEGISLVPLAGGGTAAPRLNYVRSANVTYPYRFAVRSPAYKLIDTVNPWTSELYDLSADPGEHKNIVDEPAAAATLGALRDAMSRFRARLRVTGFQLRAAAAANETHTLRVTLHGTENPRLDNPDGIALTSKDHITLAPDGLTLTWEGTVGETPVGIRFDRGLLRDPDSGLTVDIQIDGQPAPAKAVHLGASAQSPDTIPFTYKRVMNTLFAPTQETPVLLADTPPPLVVRAGERTAIYLWRTPDAQPAALTTAPTDDEARRRLKALGYVQ